MAPTGNTGTTLPSWCRIVREVTPDVVQAFSDRLTITTPSDVSLFIAGRLGAEEVEVFAVVMLDAQHRIMGFQEVTRGLVNSSLVHAREVFRLAIGIGASAIILAHNHPSGVLSPSAEDRAVTDMLVKAGALLDIPVLDHLIVGIDPNRYTSFAQSGLL